MITATSETAYASAERTDLEAIKRHADSLCENTTLRLVLDAVPLYAAILDENRQVVAANSRFAREFSSEQQKDILGLRPGEILNCLNACSPGNGCGTTESCRNCGAVNAILSAQNGVPASDDCQINTERDFEALDLNVSASPMEINGRSLTFVTVRDIASEKRLQVLERTFFHDVLNSAGGAMGLAGAIAEAEDMEEISEFAPLLVSVTEQVVAEIQSQRDLLAAEKGELKVQAEDFGSLEMLKDVHCTYAKHNVAMDKCLVIDPAAVDQAIHAGKPLLHRTLGNMVKNALEATPDEGTVTIGCNLESDHIHFWVHNSGAIPRASQLQIFHRSFTTKGVGRGIGTYSIRLLGEKYLGGRVSFESNEEKGTTFSLHLPLV